MYDLVFSHNPKTCTDPGCKCRSLRRNSSFVPEGTTTLSVRKQLVWDAPISRQNVEKALEELLLELSRYIIMDGIVLGHLKGVVKVDSAVLFISVTREDSADISPNEAWKELDKLISADLTINLLSILSCKLTEECLEGKIDSMHALLA